MSLYVDPKQSVIDAVNTANATSLKLTDVAFGDPTVAPSDVVTTTGKNTQVRLTGNGSTWTGSVVVNYTRLNLADLVTLTSNTLKVGPVTTTWDIVNYLNFYYGMILATTDIKKEDVSLDGNGAGTVTLHAEDKSFGWLGSVTLNLVKGDDLVDYAVTDLSLSGIDYPTGQSAKGQAPLVAYPYDFTSSKDFITTLTANTVLAAGAGTNGAQLATILSNAINNASYVWTANTTATNRNVYNSKVVYNGLNSSQFASNQSYKYVMMVQLSDGTGNNGVVGTSCTDFVGLLYFHYNDPVQ